MFEIHVKESQSFENVFICILVCSKSCYGTFIMMHLKLNSYHNNFYYLKLFQGEWTIFTLYLYLKLRFPYNKEKLNSHISRYIYFQIVFRIKTKDEDYSLLTYLASGNKALTLCNSSSLSKVIISTFFLAAYLMKEFCLHGLA